MTETRLLLGLGYLLFAGLMLVMNLNVKTSEFLKWVSFWLMWIAIGLSFGAFGLVLLEVR